MSSAHVGRVPRLPSARTVVKDVRAHHDACGEERGRARPRDDQRSAADGGETDPKPDDDGHNHIQDSPRDGPMAFMRF
jgi:hypothetical protein